jgi:peptidoglycan/xylan/chitin deacetylase (PgdA/CDA1 family)
MLFDHDLNGAALSPGTLCLTYDDGPGPHTAELAHYLWEERIPATFFVIGRLAVRQRELLGRLRDCGHRIGNHTWSHAGLVNLALVGGDVVEEVARADAVIRPFVDGVVPLRPPYGSWRPKRSRPNGSENSTSLVAQQLRQSGRFDHYVGPIQWDILAEDWECWRQGISVDEATRRHVEAVDTAGRGILLLHDGSEDDSLRPRNRTMQMTAKMVPILKNKGYRFVGIDAVPRIAKAFREAAGSVYAAVGGSTIR